MLPNLLATQLCVRSALFETIIDDHEKPVVGSSMQRQKCAFEIDIDGFWLFQARPPSIPPMVAPPSESNVMRIWCGIVRALTRVTGGDGRFGIALRSWPRAIRVDFLRFRALANATCMFRKGEEVPTDVDGICLQSRTVYATLSICGSLQRDNTIVAYLTIPEHASAFSLFPFSSPS